MPVSSKGCLSKATQALYDKYVYDPNGLYGSNNLIWHFHVVTGAVTDEAGEPVQVTMPTSWFELVVDIMTGKQPIEYYDEWLEAYYDGGGREWEKHATRLYGPK